MLTDEMRADGWIEHDGGPCPVPEDAFASLLFRDGEVCDVADSHFPAWHWDWEHSLLKNADDDIIAYKPETPHAD